MSDFDPVHFGRLIQSVETLTDELKTISNKVENLSTQITGSKGVIVGLLIAAGGIGATASEFIKHLFGK
jgi:hypothetical protein